MPPKHNKKHDRVMVLATRFDEGSEDRNGDVFSVVHARAGLGLCAHGTVTHVCSLSSKPTQTCKIKHDDDGGQHPSVEAHVLPEPADGDESASEDESPPRAPDDDRAFDDPADLARPDETRDPTVTDSENDEDPHDLEGQDLDQHVDMGVRARLPGAFYHEKGSLRDLGSRGEALLRPPLRWREGSELLCGAAGRPKN